MNTHLRRRLLADAAVNSHAHPARVDRALRYGTSRYRRRVTSIYAVVLTVSAVVFLALVAGHPAARLAFDAARVGSTAPPAGGSPAATRDSDVVLTSISIVPGAVTLAAGATARLGVVGNFSDGSSGRVDEVPTWQSDDDTIARVSPQGIVTALRPDENAVITASLAGFTDSTTVIVEAKVLERISIRSVQSNSESFQKDLEPDGLASLPVGGEARLVADGAYSDGTTSELAGVAWDSDQESVATVDSMGALRAVDVGTARITASQQGALATIAVEVDDDSVVE